MPTLLLRDDRFLAHDPGPRHPENARRLQAVHDDLDARPIPGTVTEAPRAARRPELARVHQPDHITRIEQTAGHAHVRLDSDTVTSAASHQAALLAAGAVLRATEEVVSGHAQGGFALVRPPGHHAEAGLAMGFCLFNNVAVAAEHAVTELGLRRVLILDPDVHHGNGTQRTFWERRDILYVSSHRFPFYPGTGWFDEVGAGEGEGYTLNLPMPPGMGDADFYHLYHQMVSPVVAEFRPELILVSAGLDTWGGDPMGGMNITEDGYRALFGLFQHWAETYCPGRLVFALEGGYAPAGIVAGVRAAIELMAGVIPAPEGVEGLPSERARAIQRQARLTLSPYWGSLRD